MAEIELLLLLMLHRFKVDGRLTHPLPGEQLPTTVTTPLVVPTTQRHSLMTLCCRIDKIKNVWKGKETFRGNCRLGFV